MTQPSPYFIRRTGALEEPGRGNGFGIGAFEEEEGRIDLLSYWHIVRKRLALVLGVMFAVLVLTTIYAYMQTPMYTAAATIMLRPGTPQIMGGKDASQDQDIVRQRRVREFSENPIRNSAQPHAGRLRYSSREPGAQPGISWAEGTAGTD